LPLTPEKYFEWEAQQPLRYEYFDGEVFAMAGGSLAHADIALNFASILREKLRGRCKVRNSDARVGITDTGPFTYPDISITCDERDHTAQQFNRYPCVIIEVVSPSTEAYDRGGKFAFYRRLPTLQEYVLVGSEVKAIDMFRRNALGKWTFIPYGDGENRDGENRDDEIIELATLGLTVPIGLIYEDVILDPAQIAPTEFSQPRDWPHGKPSKPYTPRD
jgi:Uma2 family endonuclease